MVNAQNGNRLFFDFIDDDIGYARDNALTGAFHITGAAIGWKLDQSVNAGAESVADFLRGQRVIFRDKLEQRGKVIVGKTRIAEIHAPYLA